MAGEWIKIEIGLADKPEVLRIARLLKIDRDAVVGKLVRLWAWFDTQSVDGHVDGAVSTDVDALVRQTGFAEALRDVGWLTFDDEAEVLSLPNFARHNGETAKKRALSNRRQTRWRRNDNAAVDGHVDAHVDAPPSTNASTREEKRREEYSSSLDSTSKTSARARDPTDQAAAEIGIRCLELAGLADSPTPTHAGAVRQWLADGADPERDIYPTIERVAEHAATAGKRIKSLAYFTDAVREARERRTTAESPNGRHTRFASAAEQEAGERGYAELKAKFIHDAERAGIEPDAREDWAIARIREQSRGAGTTASRETG